MAGYSSPLYSLLLLNLSIETAKIFPKIWILGEKFLSCDSWVIDEDNCHWRKAFYQEKGNKIILSQWQHLLGTFSLLYCSGLPSFLKAKPRRSLFWDPPPLHNLVNKFWRMAICSCSYRHETILSQLLGSKDFSETNNKIMSKWQWKLGLVKSYVLEK